jgi:hypothetical protein
VTAVHPLAGKCRLPKESPLIARMLSVGREIYVATKSFLCRQCAWEGRGASLSTGLIRVVGSLMYVYAYRCPDCGSFDVASKGKLLPFRSLLRSAVPDNIQRRTLDDKAKPFVAARESKGLWR